MSRFVCTNIKELQAKGLTPLGDLILDIDVVTDIVVGSIIIYDITTDTVTTFKPKVVANDALWIITEDSFTDNLDNDTFTYFKYRVM